MTGRRTSLLLGGFAVAEVAAGVVVAAVAGMSFDDALNAFVVTNGLMGVSFAVCGAVIARHRPDNAVGWLFIADGLGHATGALAAPIAALAHDRGAPAVIERVASTVLMYSWPWSIGLFLPLALLLVPDGRVESAVWRVVTWGVVLTSPLFVAEIGLDPQPVTEGYPRNYLTTRHYDDLSALWTVSELRTSIAIGLAVVSLVASYRRGDEQRRRQLLWLVLAAILVIAVVVPWSFVSGTPIVVLLAIPLIPVAVAVGIVRAQLLDIRLVVSRALAWLLLSLGAVAGYVVLVAALDTVISARVGRSALVTVLVALALAPLLPRVQRLVDRWMYGDRSNPARVASRVGEELLAGGHDDLTGVADAVRTALRLPYVAVHSTGAPLAEAGTSAGVEDRLPLSYAGQVVGEIVVGLRPGERRLSAADRSTLAIVAASLALAVRAFALSDDLRRSREGLVVAREEERRRIRQDLHDGLGAALTGIALSADAAANLVDTDPATSSELLTALRHDVRDAIADVRRLVDDLRPPALDELGLLQALRQRADQLAWRPDGTTIDVRLDVPDTLPALPAAVEVAAFRIATEALTNVARHAGASGAVLRLECDGRLDLAVLDDGDVTEPWSPGVGLAGMRERAVELGGHFEAGPCSSGGRVFVSLPLDAA
ncbi:sensor histidine kinase [Nocardioides sp. MH1]|uniref:sensor histidine kinase n=1 Tax=Nocardioides sp. MH1 TaxID=3242490 RepID=UPI0035200B1E